MGVLTGKVTIVTGATAGIGRATAVAFAREGARLVLASRRKDEGEETLALVQQAGAEGIFVTTDITQEAQVEALVRQATDTYGRLDCAVNDAGFDVSGAITDDTAEDFASNFDTNAKGTFFCLKYELRAMRATGGGAIVNIGSVAGQVPIPGNTLYGASKRAVTGLTQSAAVEGGPHGIRVNEISPGTTLTEMLLKYIAMNSARGYTLDAYNRTTVLGRIGKPEELAAAILFLCSDAASYITGVTLTVDGGATLRTGVVPQVDKG